MFDDFFDEFERFFRESWAEPEVRERVYASYVSPAYDVWENDGKVFITVELPGVKEKNIELKVLPYRLIVKAERPKKTEQSFDGYYRNIRLPAPVKEQPLQKTFKNGVLELIFEKDFNRKTRIEVR
jgi:HSP20 family protein